MPCCPGDREHHRETRGSTSYDSSDIEKPVDTQCLPNPCASCGRRWSCPFLRVLCRLDQHAPSRKLHYGVLRNLFHALCGEATVKLAIDHCREVHARNQRAILNALNGLRMVRNITVLSEKLTTQSNGTKFAVEGFEQEYCDRQQLLSGEGCATAGKGERQT